MFCQLDQVGQVLNIAETAAKQVSISNSEGLNFTDYTLKTSSVVFGLLLINEYDVFIKKGSMLLNNNRQDFFWVELYLDGQPFILTAFNGDKPRVIFLPEEEAEEEYDLKVTHDIEWDRDQCEESIWMAIIDSLQINKSLNQIFNEILNLT